MELAHVLIPGNIQNEQHKLIWNKMITAEETTKDQSQTVRSSGLKNRWLVALLVFIFVAPLVVSEIFSHYQKRENINIEDAWTNAPIPDSIVNDILKNQKCGSTDNQFLACLNGVSYAASKLDMILDLEQGLRSMYPNEEFAHEKKMVTEWAVWKKKHPQDSLYFDKIWEALTSKDLLSRKNIKNTEGQLNLMKAALINGFWSISIDPHSYIIPLDYYKQTIGTAENQSQSLGLVLKKTTMGLVVQKVFKNSPAEFRNLQRDDLILTVDGENTHQWSLRKFQEKVKLTTKPLHLELRRWVSVAPKSGLALAKKSTTLKELPSVESKFFKVTLEKKIFNYKAVEGHVLAKNPSVGLLSIDKFSIGVCDQTKEVINSFNLKQVRKVIIDLRDNSGGSLEEASCFLGIFLKPNEKTYEVHYLDNEKPPESFYAKGPQLYDGPLGVLINAGTASAAELVAGSLRISQGAVLMGQRTFGKGSFQEGEIWKSHKKIAAFRTQGFYYLSDKTSPQLVGISPQIELPTIPELVLGVSNIENFREEDSYYHPLKAPIIKAPAAELSQNETIQGFDLCLKKGSPTLATASVEKINSEEQDMAFLVRYLDCNVQTLGAQNDSYRSF